MDALSRLFAVLTVTLTVGGVTSLAEQTPVPNSPPPVLVAQNAIQRVWRDPVAVAKPKALCPQWWDAALEAGWELDQLPTLDQILHRESRCLTQAHNTTLNVDGSTDIGLTQINDRSWCLPTRWYPNGYLQTLGIINYCKDLFDPLTNLKAAKTIYDYAQKTSGNGFRPWGK
jgi:hypothetical protein